MKRTFTKYLGGFILLSILALTSCQKDGLDYTERRMVGTWTFDKADLSTGLFSSDDMMSDYDADVLTLNPDFSAEYYDDETKTRSTGTWVKTHETVDDCVTTVLTINLTRTSDSHNHVMEMHHVTVNKRKLRGGMETQNGKVDFVLLKQ